MLSETKTEFASGVAYSPVLKYTALKGNIIITTIKNKIIFFIVLSPLFIIIFIKTFFILCQEK